MVRTILVTPPLKLKERMGALAGGGAVMPGLGILYIAAYMRGEGLEVSILDAEGRGMDARAALKVIVKQNPQIVGITATTLSITSATALAKEIKAKAPHIKVLVGGPHVTAMPSDTMDRFPQIDACILGEGELSFTKVVQNVANGVAMSRDVNGLVWRNGSEILISAKEGHLDNLDILPMPAWDLLNGFPQIYRPTFHSYRRLPVANIITTRGCPCVCSFCDRSVFGQKVHSHSTEYVIEMIEYLIKDFGIKEISIKDDMFVLSNDRVVEFCRQIRNKKLDITWSCNARVNSVNDEMLKEMKSAGCWMISYGIESGSPKMLKRMMKGITRKQIINALELSRKHGIVSKGFFIIGIPGETIETMKETLNFIKKIPLDELNINFFCPFPGTELFNEVLNEGFEIDFERMNMLEPVYVPRGLRVADLTRYQKKIIKSFYFNASKIATYGLRAFHDYGEFKRIIRMGKMVAGSSYQELRKAFGIGR